MLVADTMNTTRDVQYIGGYHEYIGGYPAGTSGNVQYIGVFNRN